nr:ABC transporter ATP-binding protein [Desulfobulbaceae bacterium]
MTFKQIQNTNSLKFLGPYFKKYSVRITVGLVALLGVDLLQLLVPRVIKSAIDGLNSGLFTPHQLINHALSITGLALGVAVFRFIWRYLILGFSRLLEQEIRNKLFEKLLSLDRAYFQKHTTGELMALSSNDLSAVQLACGMGLVSFVDALFMTVAVVGFMLYISPLLTLITLLPLPLLAFLTRHLSGKLHLRFKSVQEQFSKLTEVARSTISSMRLIKVYTQEENQTKRFDDLGQTYIEHSVKVAKIQGLLFPISGLIANFSLLLIILVGAQMVINKTITVGDFVAFVSYLLMMTWPMMAIGWVANLFQRGATSLGRIQKVLNDQPLLDDTEASLSLSQPIDLISLSLNSFSYPGQQSSVLKTISLSYEKGLYGIVGKTGSGKTTLCQLLARMFPVPDGSIFINGHDINRYQIGSYRKCIAYVPQDALLFSDTIAFNIAFGVPAATQDQIETVARMVGIHDEITSFTNGYATRIGEKGVKLSGGQRQRISLARAFMTKAPVLIIDDSLSAVDSGTEKHILKSLNRYAEQAIVIVVSNRLSPLRNARSIAVLNDGLISAVGTHQYLIEHSSYYQIIYANQADN